MTRGCVDTDERTAGYLGDLVGAEAAAHLSEINVVANAVLRHLAAAVLTGAPTARVLELARLADDGFWAVLLQDPTTSEMAQRLREDPLHWTASAVQPADDASSGAIEHTVHRLYLDLPLIDGGPNHLPSPVTPPAPVRYRVTARG